MTKEKTTEPVKPTEEKTIDLKKYVVIGLDKDGTFYWSAKNVTNLFEVLGYLNLAADDIKRKMQETLPQKK